MQVLYCIATRGKAGLLAQTLPITARTRALESTRVLVDLDEDDAESVTWASANALDRVTYNIGPRPDSLGEKYNRLTALATGPSIFCLGVDDSGMATQGWDESIAKAMDLFPDGLGVLHYSRPQGAQTIRFPAIMCMSSAFASHMGFFAAPYFPAWWHDTWIDEVAQFTGRLLWLDGEMFYPAEQGGTRGLRDVSFWATFFDMTRVLRCKTAEAIIDAGADAPYHKIQLKNNFQPLIGQFLGANAHLRDPLGAMQFETRGFDCPEDERYQRLKAAAEAMMMEGFKP